MSAIVYAFKCHHEKKQHEVLLPLLAFPRADLILRRESLALLEKINVDITSLLFQDDVNDWKEIPCTTKVILTDHNVLSKANTSLSSFVTEIIDHHMDAGLYSHSVLKRNIAFDTHSTPGGKALVGSCCSLVAESMYDFPTVVIPEIATMLLAAMCLDTLNFKPEATKVTERDIQAMLFLKPYCLMSVNDLFDWLQEEKCNRVHWQTVSLRDLLRCDFKRFTIATFTYGISSVLLPLSDVLVKEDSGMERERVLTTYCENEMLDFLFLLTNFRNENEEKDTVSLIPQRQILLFAPAQEVLDRVHSILQSMSDDLVLGEACKESPLLVWYTQKNASISRKNFVPLFHKAVMDDNSSSNGKELNAL